MMRSMIRSVVVPLLGLSLACSPAGASDLDALRWLEGDWKRESKHRVVYESWRALSERTLEGDSHSVSNATGEKRLGEAMLLAEMAGEVFYIPRPAENPYPVAFRLVSSDGGEAAFENPGHDFPQRIVYRRTGERSMTVSIEGPGEAGKAPRKIEFHFTRAE